MTTILTQLLDELNDDQKLAVYTNLENVALVAGAGTGKTQTLICRILYQVESLKIDPESILALTFTNAAGREMESRYKLSCSRSSSPYFGTFHSFCYKLICSDRTILNKLGYLEIPTIASNEEESLVLSQAQILTSVKLPKYAYKITYSPKASEEFEYNVFQKTVDKLLRESNKITFDRLCYKVCDLFSKNDASITKYKNQYQYIYVDEFQDTDPLQWEFVKSFYGMSNIFVVGDTNQAIYQFRGADSSIFKNIAAGDDFSTLKLEKNYRSTQEICDYANNFLKSVSESDSNLEIKLQAFKRGLEVTEITMSQFYNVLETKSFDYESCAILCRTNKEVETVSNMLTSYSIDHKTKIEHLEYKALYSALNEEFYEAYLLSLLPEISRSHMLKDKYIKNKSSILPELKLLFPNIVRYVEEITDSENFGDIRTLYEAGELSIADISQIADHDTKTLYIGTIHSVKGLEFDEVFVYGANGYSFNITKSEELQNLFYVAITRARESLHIVFQESR